MIRFAWLQSRTQAAVAFAALAILAVALVLTGPHLAHLYSTLIAPCIGDGSCSPTTIELFQRNHRLLRGWLGIGIVVVPGLIGIFWGAPLVARELEAGTFRLAWTQSVSRTRWIAIKLSVALVVSMAVAGLLSFMITWWAHPLDRVRDNVFATFDQRDIVPIGYAAFGFVLGVTVGVLIRRTVPAMATVVVVFTAARVGVNQWLRARLIAPLHLIAALNPASTGFGRTNDGPATLQPEPPHIPNAWIYSTHIVDNAGHALTSEVLASTCPNVAAITGPPSGTGGRTQVPRNVQDTFEQCISSIGAKYHEVVAYQPGSRYWAFQWYELAVFLGASAVLALACVWWVRRRLT
jgi:hypothetical protein